MSLTIKQLPEAERPYEKLELYGEKYLSNAELLAIIIKSGTKEETSVQIAQRILNLSYNPNSGDLSFLKDLSLQELMEIKGIGRVKAIQLKAIGELSIRISRPSNYKKIKICTTEDIVSVLKEEMKNEKKEIVKLVLLNVKLEILKIVDVAHGGVNSANVKQSEIISEALKSNSPNMIVVHNHPSGDPTPSNADINFTDILYNEAKKFNIELIDHVIIAGNNYKSIYEELRKKIKRLKKTY